jgi:hypothetical protein
MTSLDEKPFESGYLLLETVIDHPVRTVWPQLLDIGSWMNAHELRTLTGRSGEIGHFEQVLPRGLPADVPEPRYHLYGIAEIIPYRMVALEVIPENGGSYGNPRDWMSFDTILLTDLGARTQLSFLMIDVNIGTGTPESRKEQDEKLQLGRELIMPFFDTLKALLREAA